MNRFGVFSPAIKRLLSCLIGATVLAMMVGKQEGSQNDYGLAFRESVLTPRIFIFLAIGVLMFLAITYWPKVAPLMTRPGFWPLVTGAATVVASQALLHWYDQIEGGKFAALSSAVAETSGLSPLAKAFFAWLAWTQFIVLVTLALVAVAQRIRVLAWAVAALCVVAAFISYLSHKLVVDLAGGIDHSLGAAVASIGYLVMACALVAVALSDEEVSRTRDFVNRVLAWRPGLPLVVLGIVVGLISLGAATWFSPKRLNATLTDTSAAFEGTGLAPLAGAYLSWLGWVLLAACAVLTGLATYRRLRIVGWIAAALGSASLVLTLVTLYNLSDLAGSKGIDQASGPWQNLGAGGWLACAAFFILGAAGYVAASVPEVSAEASSLSTRERVAPEHSATKKPSLIAGSGYLVAPGAMKTALMVAVAFALFYPPTATAFWQQVLVSEIGIYILLAVGLNVVVGWAGLLDLGFIAFYAIGSYTTAYLVGSLPIKPPEWLHMSPLLAIPFAIAICLCAGVLLGAPTLRLRGDYLAIVTLGFGEIIRIMAINMDGVTNSTRGPSPQVPHPVIHIGPIHLTWGLEQLQYWYLLLVLIVIMVIAFRRLENSRTGRAWAAIREDEVAAQATGINTTRTKLLAFAIGASTSGLAGVFFASQVGYFNPDNFVLNNSILVVAYVVFGGMGSLPGAIAGAAMLTWLPEFLRDQVPPEDRQIWIGAILLGMMIFRSAGLIPAKRRKAELSGFDSTPRAETTAVAAGEGM